MPPGTFSKIPGDRPQAFYTEAVPLLAIVELFQENRGGEVRGKILGWPFGIVANDQQGNGQSQEGDRCTKQIRPSGGRVGRFAGRATGIHKCWGVPTLGLGSQFRRNKRIKGYAAILTKNGPRTVLALTIFRSLKLLLILGDRLAVDLGDRSA